MIGFLHQNRSLFTNSIHADQTILCGRLPGISHVIFIICATAVAQNMKITWETPDPGGLISCCGQHSMFANPTCGNSQKMNKSSQTEALTIRSALTYKHVGACLIRWSLNSLAVNSSGGTSVSSLKSVIRNLNRFDNQDDIGFGTLTMSIEHEVTAQLNKPHQYSIYRTELVYNL